MTDKLWALLALTLIVLLLIPERQPVRREPMRPTRQAMSRPAATRVSGRFVF